jgi:hypothetical protein
MTLPRSSSAQGNPLNPVRSSQKDTSGLTILLEKGVLRCKVCSYLMICEIALTYGGRGVEIKRNLGERLTPGAESGAPFHYALQSQAMRSNLSTHNSGGPIE